MKLTAQIRLQGGDGYGYRRRPAVQAPGRTANVLIKKQEEASVTGTAGCSNSLFIQSADTRCHDNTPPAWTTFGNVLVRLCSTHSGSGMQDEENRCSS